MCSQVFTTSCRKAFKSISYNMQDDEEEEDAAEDDDLKVEVWLPPSWTKNQNQEECVLCRFGQPLTDLCMDGRQW